MSAPWITWLYYSPNSGKAWPGGQILITPPGTETVGQAQLELMLRARASRHGQVVMPHDREHNAARMAARRLQERGLLEPGRMVGGSPGSWKLHKGRPVYLYVYTLTERGRTCWLRVKK